MLQRDRERPRTRDERDLIWTREDVIVTAGQDPRTGRPTYYVKLTETDEIFELGEVEHEVWQQFADGCSLDAAERAVAERMGSEFRPKFRSLVAEFAMRGLLRGAIPDELLEEFAADPRARRVHLQYQIDPNERDPTRPYYRFPLFDANRLFGQLAKWFWFLKYSIWPIGLATVVAGLVLIKHSVELHADFPPKVLTAYGIPHGLFTLITINIARNVVMGAVIRHYGARVRVFSLDLRFGFWPRFHVDKRGMLRLKRTPQLWAHSSTFFVRLAFFSFGALGWWAFRGDGTTKSALFLLACQAGLIDMIVSALPFFKSETYYWFAAYFEEPFLRERAQAALRSVFSRRTNPFDLPPIERTALVAYGLSMVASLLLVAYSVANLFMAWTGRYRGTGLALYLAVCAMFAFWLVMRRARRQKKETAQAEKRERRRQGRRDRAAEFAPLAEVPGAAHRSQGE